jgi:hypothetical protein
MSAPRDTVPETALAEAIDLVEATGHFVIGGEDRLCLLTLLACLGTQLRQFAAERGVLRGDDAESMRMNMSNLVWAMKTLGEGKTGETLTTVFVRILERTKKRIEKGTGT